MKKLVFIFCCILSIDSYAAHSCDRLAQIADKHGVMYGTKYSFTVVGKKGFRSYFHSAPSEQCKLKNTFIIPNDSVIAYQDFKHENQDWMYVMYIDKNGNDTSGWVKAKDFKVSSRMSPN